MGDAGERALIQVDGVTAIVVRARDHEIRRAVRRAVDVRVVRVGGAGVKVIDVESAGLVAGWSTVQV